MKRWSCPALSLGAETKMETGWSLCQTSESAQHTSEYRANYELKSGVLTLNSPCIPYSLCTLQLRTLQLCILQALHPTVYAPHRLCTLQSMHPTGYAMHSTVSVPYSFLPVTSCTGDSEAGCFCKVLSFLVKFGSLTLPDLC